MSGGWEAWALVAAGGAVGAASRHLLSAWSARAMGAAAHWGTWAVNCSGAGLLGVLLGLFPHGQSYPGYGWLLLGVGALGSYTTVSTLALQLLQLAQDGRRRAAAACLLATLAGGLVAFLLGHWLAAR